MSEQVDMDSVTEQLEDDFVSGWPDLAVGCVQCIGIHIIGGEVGGTYYLLQTDSYGGKSCGPITPEYLRDLAHEIDGGTYDCFCGDV